MKRETASEPEGVNLREALKRGQIEVWFQPQYDHATGAVLGAEALARWRHPERGLLPPGEFLGDIARAGLSDEFDMYIWAEVCARLGEWAKAGLNPPPVSVNVCEGGSLGQESLAKYASLARESGAPEGLLRLEIPEAAFADNGANTARAVERLSEMGFPVEIDDFGGGHLALRALKDARVSALKLDMRDLAANDELKRGGIILESIVRMAQWLDIAVIAKKVETLEQADYMLSIGCNCVQGFLYARPLPAKEYAELLKSVTAGAAPDKLVTEEHLDVYAFWSPRSMDTLIFNSFVGNACIFEYHNGHIELLRATKKFLELFWDEGASVRDAQRVKWANYLDAENTRALRETIERSIQSGDEFIREFQFKGLPGCPELLHIRATLRVIASAGKRHLVYCMNENITRQREAEQRKAEAERKQLVVAEQLKAILANISGGVCAVTIGDAGGVRFVFANEQYFNILGYTRAQFEAEVNNAFDVIHPQDADAVRATIAKIIETGQSNTFEYRCIRRDGKTIFLRCSSAIAEIGGVEGAVLLSVITDNTAEKLIERKIRRNDQQLQFLNDTAHDLLAQTDAELGIESVLRKTLDYFDGDRTFIYEYRHAENICANTYEVCAPGEISYRDKYQSFPLDTVWHWLKTFENSNFFHMDDANLLGEDRAAESAMLRTLNVKSALAVSLRAGGEVIGAMGVFNPKTHLTDYDNLAALGDYIAVILTRRDLHAKIERDSEEIRNMMNDTPCGFRRMRVCPDGQLKTEYVNDRFCKIRGMTHAEIMANERENALNAVHPDDLERVRNAIRQMISSGDTTTIKYRFRQPGGKYIWLMSFGRISRSESGSAFINAYFTDLSVRENKELSIKETMPIILSAIMKSSTDLVFAKDRDFRYICASPAFTRFAGQEEERQLIGKTDYDLFSKATADQFRTDDEKLFESGESLVNYVEPIPSPDGTPHYCQTSKYILRDASGEVIGMYGIGRDITENRTTFERLKLVTDSIPGGIAAYACSPGSIRTTYFNDGFCKLLGFTREEFEQLSDDNVVGRLYEDDRRILMSQLNELILNDTPIDCTYRVHTPQGGLKWINMRGTPAERHGDTVFVNTVQFDVTERIKAEEQLRVHEQEMQLAMSQMGRMICEYDPAARAMTLPESYAARYGAPTVIRGSDVSEGRVIRVDAEYRGVYAEFFREIVSGAATGACEYRSQWADGSYHWERAEFSVIFSSELMPLKAIITVEDTTSQRLQYELEQSRPSLGEENLLVHALINLTTGETLDYAYRDGGAVPLSDRTVLSYGDDTADALFLNGDERAQYRRLNDVEYLLNAYANGETELSMDYRRRLPNGDAVWVRCILRMVRKPGGSDILLFAYFYDVEDEKTKDLMYTALVNESYDFVARVNGKNKRFSIIANAGVPYAMPPQSGDDLDAVARQIAETYVHPDDRRMTLENTQIEGIKRNLAKQDRYHFNARIIRPDGTIRYKKFTEWYLDREREIFIVIREDVSSVVYEEMRKNELLADALAAANQASQAKTHFLSRMSHELRTPMNAIIGLAALSAAEVHNPEAMKNAIGKIGMSARYLLSLINDILEMSRIESGRMTLNEAPFDFEQFVSDVNAIIYAQASAKDVDYDTIVNSYLEPTYVGDATKLQEVLVNVLGNAVKFTPRGGKVTLAIEQLRCVNRVATLRFIINDTGIGIDSEYLPHLFEPFSQETDSLTASAAGTGLGLAITKNLVEMMNGQISVQSIKNVGSVFTIDVQLGVSENSQQYLDMIASMKLDKLRALVVDDDIVVCQSTEGILRAMGMQAEWADSGPRAVKRVKEAHADKRDFDIVFIDWKMPDMDGIETTRQIRSIIGPDVTIIIMTAYDWRTIETRAREAGVDLFMEKPLFQSSIVKAFENIFRANKDKIQPVAAQRPDLSGKRILLTEDHPLNVEVAKRLLERVNAEVVVASNGLEAMEIFTTAEDGYFDAILMDIRMPVMDGLTATKNIRNLRKKGSRIIPIIAMTANAFDEDVELSLHSGMDAHLAKPIEPQVLYSTLLRLMRANAQRE